MHVRSKTKKLQTAFCRAREIRTYSTIHLASTKFTVCPIDGLWRTSDWMRCRQKTFHYLAPNPIQRVLDNSGADESSPSDFIATFPDSEARFSRENKGLDVTHARKAEGLCHCREQSPVLLVPFQAVHRPRFWQVGCESAHLVRQVRRHALMPHLVRHRVVCLEERLVGVPSDHHVESSFHPAQSDGVHCNCVVEPAHFGSSQAFLKVRQTAPSAAPSAAPPHGGNRL